MEEKDTPKGRKKLSPKAMINEKSKKRGRTHPGSYSEMKKMIEETEARFVNPEPQSLLEGNPGLTLTQMSESLGIPHAEMRRKFDKSGVKKYLSQCNYDVMEFSITSLDNKQVRSYVFSVEAAKHVAASVNSLKGFLYRDFLIRSTDALKVTIEHAEEQSKTIEDLKKENCELRKIVKKKVKSYDPICNLILGSAERDSLLKGKSKVAEVAQKRKSDLTEAERCLRDIQTSIRQGLGNLKSAFNNFQMIKTECKKEKEGFDKCMQAAIALDELINKTSLERDVIYKTDKSQKKGAYIQPALLSEETTQTKYLN